MSEIQKVRGVVLGHGGMATGLVDAALRISGADADSLLPLSNQGKSPDLLQEEISQILRGGPTLIFTDLPSGSCALAARFCCRDRSDAAIIFGVNLPVLLDFVFHRDLPLDQLVPRLLQKGRGSLGSNLSE